MKVILQFDYYEKIIFIPDGYIVDLKHVHLQFFDWITSQPGGFQEIAGHGYVSYDYTDFIRYINEEILKDTDEKAYEIFKLKGSKKKILRLRF